MGKWREKRRQGKEGKGVQCNQTSGRSVRLVSKFIWLSTASGHQSLSYLNVKYAVLALLNETPVSVLGSKCQQLEKSMNVSLLNYSASCMCTSTSDF